MKQEDYLKKIELADHAYYDQSRPIMTDAEYDLLKQSYEATYGPIDQVPGEYNSIFQKYVHKVPLLSLDKLHDDDPLVVKRLEAWLAKCDKVVLEPKIDGLTIAAVPTKQGYRFVTRGRNGIEGEILPNFPAKYLEVQPKSNVTLRGEAYISAKNFKLVCEKQQKKGEEQFANQRNAASGILRNLQASPWLQYLNFAVYEIPGSNLSATEQLSIIRKSGFPCIPSIECEGKSAEELLNSIRNLYTRMTTDKDLLNIPIDGIVVKYDIKNSLRIFGSTNHHPNNAIAWKRSADLYETTVKDITWQVGRLYVTPVAELDPIQMNGTTVKRATLHNANYVREVLKLAPGDVVSIYKSGEIIPKILGVTARSGNDPFKIIDRCPACNEPLKSTFSNELVCINDKCPEKIARNIAHLASKDVLNIPGLSLQTARKIIDKRADCDETVIFDLKEKDFLKLPGFGLKNAEKLYKAVQKAKNTPVTLSTYIKACCVIGLGDDVGKILESKFKTGEALLKALKSEETLSALSGLGPVTVKTLMGEEFTTKFLALTDYLTIKQSMASRRIKQAATGTHWVITGKFEKTRKVITEEIESIGGQVDSDLTKKTTYLLQADPNSTSSKSVEAKERGISIVSYDFLKNLIEIEAASKTGGDNN